MSEIYAMDDAFGRPYEVPLILRWQAQYIVERLAKGEIYRMALSEYTEGYGSGYVYLDLSTGQVVSYQLRENESLRESGHMVLLAAYRDVLGTAGIFAWSEDIDEQLMEIYG